MDEKILTGYCRCIDGHRMVTSELDGGRWYADCSFGNCPYESVCEIAKQLQQLCVSKSE